MARKEQLLISLHYLDLSVRLEFNNISEDDTIVATVSISFYSDRDQLTRYSLMEIHLKTSVMISDGLTMRPDTPASTCHEPRRARKSRQEMQTVTHGELLLTTCMPGAPSNKKSKE